MPYISEFEVRNHIKQHTEIQKLCYIKIMVSYSAKVIRR